MSGRRDFLKGAGALAVFGPYLATQQVAVDMTKTRKAPELISTVGAGEVLTAAHYASLVARVNELSEVIL